MAQAERFHERVVRVEKPVSHFTLIRSPSGQFLGASEGQVGVYDQADDKVIWDVEDGGFRHVQSGLTLRSESVDHGCLLNFGGQVLGESGQASSNGAVFVSGHGPAHMPSEYLATLRQQGWVCFPSIVPPDQLEALEEASCTGPWDHLAYDRSTFPIALTSAVAKVAAEPVSLWVTRQYMASNDIKLAHTPSFSILSPDDGQRNVQGWHSDYPYLWGIASNDGGNRIPVHQVDGLVMGVQRNLCISEFRKENGATCFKLGTHRLGQAPPEAWGNGVTYKQEGYRAENGLPYHGDEADVIEAPAGSYIIYDSRTWHRAGVNRTEHKRAAMLQAVVPMYIMPFSDTSKPYKKLLESSFYDELTDLEKKELTTLLIHRVDGKGIKNALTVDAELTQMLNQ